MSRRRLAEVALGALVGAALTLALGAAPDPPSAIRNPQFSTWRVVGVVVEDAAGQRFTLPLAGLDMPTATATPPPTNTPRSMPTVTASATPAPDTPTPTREVTVLPPLTPRPTNPPPDEAVCMAGVKTSALNIRADHSTTATVVGKLAQGERVQIEAVFVRYPEGSVNREEWGRLADGRGWIALWHAGRQLAALDDAPACWEIPISYASARPASLFGLHLIYSARADVLTVPGLGLLKGTDGTQAIIRAAKQQRPNVLTVWRNLSTGAGRRDCPDGWGQGDPRAVAEAWWGEQYAAWRARELFGYVDYFEVLNECGAPYWRWENEFWLRTLELATEARVCLAVFSDAYGTPEIVQFVARQPVLDRMLAHECMPGRRHAVALHIYEGADGGPWKFGRWRLFLGALGQRYAALPWLVTEYGYAYGTGPVECAAFWADWARAEKQFAPYPEVWGVAHFSVGASPVWTNLEPCVLP